MDNDAKIVAKGITYGIINNIINIILPFISRTIIINKLGAEFAGLGSLFTSILQVLSLSELGVGAAVSFTLYRPLVENDRERVDAILLFYRLVYHVIGVVILLLAIIIFPFLGHLISGDVPEGININILYVVYVLNTVSSYLFGGYKSVLLSANKRYDVQVKVTSVVTMAQHLLQIVLLLIFCDYYLYVFVVPVTTIVNNVISYVMVNRLFPGYECKGRLNKIEIKSILKITLGSFFAKIGSTVYLSADNIVISAFLGLTVLGNYNSYYYVLNALITVFAVVHNTLRPVIGQNIIKQSKEDCWEQFEVLNTVYMTAVVFCCSCCLSLFQDFEFLLYGSENMFPLSIVVLLVFYFFSGRVSCMLCLYQEAAGLMWKGKFVPLISALLNLMVNIILVQYIGLYGILVSSILASVIVSFPGYMYIVFGEVLDRKKRKKYICDSLLYLFEMCTVCSITYAISRKILVQGFGCFFAKCIVVAVLSIILVILFNLKNRRFSDGIRLLFKHGKAS